MMILTAKVDFKKIMVILLSLAAVLLVTVTVVTLRSLSAATSDPVDAIKTE